MPATASAKVSDYFAELYVAGRFADAGWNVYFPHRDEGFDFIITKEVDGQQLIRPVQVKGKYATEEKGYKKVYGYVGDLSQLHPDMVLAIPFFTWKSQDLPTCVAYLPRSLIKLSSRGFRCEPASYHNDQASPRAHYSKFFGVDGLSLLESPMWSGMTPGL